MGRLLQVSAWGGMEGRGTAAGKGAGAGASRNPATACMLVGGRVLCRAGRAYGIYAAPHSASAACMPACTPARSPTADIPSRAVRCAGAYACAGGVWSCRYRALNIQAGCTFCDSQFGAEVASGKLRASSIERWAEGDRKGGHAVGHTAGPSTAVRSFLPTTTYLLNACESWWMARTVVCWWVVAGWVAAQLRVCARL